MTKEDVDSIDREGTIAGIMLLAIFIFIGFLLAASGQWADSQATAAYNKAVNKPYITISVARKIIKKANDAPNGHSILKKLNNKVVVDNRDGREYIITINIPSDDDRDKDSTYSLAPRIGKKDSDY